MDVALTDFKLQVIRQGGLFIAYSHKLDVSTTGKSEQQALDNFSDLVQIFMREMIRTEQERPGVLEHTLLQLGWKKTRSRWSPPPA